MLNLGYARALHVLHVVSGNNDSSSLLETSSTGLMRDTGAIVFEIRGLRRRYSVAGRDRRKITAPTKFSRSDRNEVSDRPKFAFMPIGLLRTELRDINVLTQYDRAKLTRCEILCSSENCL